MMMVSTPSHQMRFPNLELTYRFSPMPRDRKCYTDADEWALRLSCFKGDVVMKVGGLDFGLEGEPLLDFALSFHHALLELESNGSATFEYSDGGPTIDLSLNDQVATFREYERVADADLEDVVRQHLLLMERLLGEMHRLFPAERPSKPLQKLLSIMEAAVTERRQTGRWAG
jgi:hypothetical protein